MIKMLSDNVKMVFGTGDIGINSGIYKEDSNNIMGIIIFYNQTPRKIGAPADVPAGTSVNIDEFPVLMEFHKPESIDVVINALSEAKEMMLNNYFQEE